MGPVISPFPPALTAAWAQVGARKAFVTCKVSPPNSNSASMPAGGAMVGGGSVGVNVGVCVGLGVGVGVEVGKGVAVAVGVEVGVSVAVGEGEVVAVWVGAKVGVAGTWAGPQAVKTKTVTRTMIQLT